jgi:putative oxidoreductase
MDVLLSIRKFSPGSKTLRSLDGIFAAQVYNARFVFHQKILRSSPLSLYRDTRWVTGVAHYERVIMENRRKEGAEMNIAFLVGRIIFGGYWLMASFNHFKNLNYMSEYAKARGTPFPKLAVAGTGVILLLGGLSMLLGVYPVIGIVLLIIFLLGVSFQMHSFWKMDDAQMKQIDMINFTKNMALIGALLMFLLLAHPWPGDRLAV